jgi:hypothetical protein
VIPAAGAADRPEVVDPPAFLRLDPPELQEGSLVIRAVSPRVREHRRLSPDTPLGYLYERPPQGVPERDLSFAAGNYDEARLVWSFSGELTGILGITEPMGPA